MPSSVDSGSEAKQLKRRVLAGAHCYAFLTWPVSTCPRCKHSFTSSVWALLCRWDNASSYPSVRLFATHNPPWCWHFPARPVWTHSAVEASLALSVSMADKEVSHPLIYPALILLCPAILLPLTPPSSSSTRPYVYIQHMVDCMNSSDRVALRWHLTFSCPSTPLIHLALGTHSSPGFIHLLM